ncbi:hypothetical protein BC830DRAFT_1189971 [Chytriomyces sp. MP71]|nr:hypothetical protein BC830DRAFT_1189971 [Chytriomyces sp. MP71]
MSRPQRQDEAGPGASSAPASKRSLFERFLRDCVLLAKAPSLSKLQHNRQQSSPAHQHHKRQHVQTASHSAVADAVAGMAGASPNNFNASKRVVVSRMKTRGDSAPLSAKKGTRSLVAPPRLSSSSASKANPRKIKPSTTKTNTSPSDTCISPFISRLRTKGKKSPTLKNHQAQIQKPSELITQNEDSDSNSSASLTCPISSNNIKTRASDSFRRPELHVTSRTQLKSHIVSLEYESDSDSCSTPIAPIKVPTTERSKARDANPPRKNSLFPSPSYPHQSKVDTYFSKSGRPGFAKPSQLPSAAPVVSGTARGRETRRSSVEAAVAGIKRKRATAMEPAGKSKSKKKSTVDAKELSDDPIEPDAPVIKSHQANNPVNRIMRKFSSDLIGVSRLTVKAGSRLPARPAPAGLFNNVKSSARGRRPTTPPSPPQPLPREGFFFRNEHYAREPCQMTQDDHPFGERGQPEGNEKTSDTWMRREEENLLEDGDGEDLEAASTWDAECSARVEESEGYPQRRRFRREDEVYEVCDDVRADNADWCMEPTDGQDEILEASGCGWPKNSDEYLLLHDELPHGQRLETSFIDCALADDNVNEICYPAGRNMMPLGQSSESQESYYDEFHGVSVEVSHYEVQDAVRPEYFNDAAYRDIGESRDARKWRADNSHPTQDVWDADEYHDVGSEEKPILLQNWTGTKSRFFSTEL